MSKKLEKILLTHKVSSDFNMVINENTYLIKSIVKKYLGRGVPFDELMLVAQEGLYKAYLKFEPTRGVKLSTFAFPYIKNEILEAIANSESKGVMSRSDVNNTYKINKIVKQYIQDNGQRPSIEEISAISGGEFSVEKVKALTTSSHCRSLDDEIAEDLTLSDVIAIEEDDTYDDALTNKVEEMMRILNEEERKIMTYYYFEEITNMAEIARMMNTNANHIRTIYLRAIKKIKNSNIRSIKEDRALREDKLKKLN